MSNASVFLDGQIEKTVPLRVLVLDDDRFDRKRIKRWAKPTADVATNVMETATLKDFGAALYGNRFDLIIVDYCLADGDGLDALDYIVACSRNFAAYVVMVSGFDDVRTARVALKRGCDRYLLKSNLTADRWADLLNDVAAFAEHRTRPGGRSVVEHWAARAARRQDGIARGAVPTADASTVASLASSKATAAEFIAVSAGAMDVQSDKNRQSVSDQDPVDTMFSSDYFDFTFDYPDF